MPVIVMASPKGGVGKSTCAVLLASEFARMGADIPATADYQAVFNRLFPPADKAQIQEAKKRIALDRSVLDTAVGDIKRFQGKLGHADRQRVEQYLTSIREVEQRMQARDNILDEGRPKFDEKGVRLEPSGG